MANATETPGSPDAGPHLDLTGVPLTAVRAAGDSVLAEAITRAANNPVEADISAAFSNKTSD